MTKPRTADGLMRQRAGLPVPEPRATRCNICGGKHVEHGTAGAIENCRDSLAQQKDELRAQVAALCEVLAGLFKWREEPLVKAEVMMAAIHTPGAISMDGPPPKPSEDMSRCWAYWDCAESALADRASTAIAYNHEVRAKERERCAGHIENSADLLHFVHVSGLDEVANAIRALGDGDGQEDTDPNVDAILDDVETIVDRALGDEEKDDE